MTTYKRLNQLSEIPDKDYQGYIWLSNASAPIYINGKFDFSEIKINPFIVEAMLFAKDQSVSIQIKDTGGNYWIDQVEWDIEELINSNEFEDYEYIVKNSNQIIVIKEKWEEIPNPMCENMSVEHPSWRAFVGFKTK